MTEKAIANPKVGFNARSLLSIVFPKSSLTDVYNANRKTIDRNERIFTIISRKSVIPDTNALV